MQQLGIVNSYTKRKGGKTVFYENVTTDVIKDVKEELTVVSMDVAVLGIYVELESLDSTKWQGLCQILSVRFLCVRN